MLLKFVIFWKGVQFDLLSKLVCYLVHFLNPKVKLKKYTPKESLIYSKKNYTLKVFLYYRMEPDLGYS